ncbi:hypothetical protein BVC80_1751g56 [Macleaya cordata]|uniref:Uncharacterized protein n=1 Tax=Macleaya cordata TaxID=56857 RepID=A0A200QHL4_MACCD|nr:hypothetical protein BVC80_1751g56 [Macleaya cordata]
MKRQRSSQARQRFHSNREMGSGRRRRRSLIARDYLEEEIIKEEKVTKDLDDHLSYSFKGFTAKAA